jgi:steroid delta-isomerase-like uncharacterized protein
MTLGNPAQRGDALDYKLLVNQWFEHVWNRRSREAIIAYMAPDCLTKVEGLDAPLTRDGFVEYHAAFISAVPDVRAFVTTVVAEGTQVVVTWRARGTHTGPGFGIPPSGRPVDFSGMSMFRFVDGQIAEGADSWNRGEMIASLMQVRMDELRDTAGLTMREAQVALLMAERYPHTAIANQLGIKANTARRHCERVMMKLGVKKRLDVGPALGKIPGTGLERHGTDVGRS